MHLIVSEGSTCDISGKVLHLAARSATDNKRVRDSLEAVYNYSESPYKLVADIQSNYINWNKMSVTIIVSCKSTKILDS